MREQFQNDISCEIFKCEQFGTDKPREARKLVLQVPRDALAKSVRASGFPFVGAGVLSEYALFLSRTWVDLGATRRNARTFTDREQDGQKPLKMNTIAADHARGQHFNLSQIWR